MAAEGKKWQKIKAEYLRGGIGYRALAAKHGVSFSQLQRVALRDKWFELKRQAEEKAGTRMVEDAAQQIAAQQKRISTVADRLLDALEEGIKAGAFVDNTRSIREIAATLKDIKEVQNVRSNIDLREQEARIEKLRREAQRDEHGDREIRIVMDPAVKDLSE